MNFHFGPRSANREQYRTAISNMLNDGMTYQQIGDELGFSRDKVSGLIKRMGLQKNKASSPQGWTAKRINDARPKVPPPPPALGPVGTFPDKMDCCRYPVNPDGGEFQVCAQPGFPYCTYHRELCCIPIKLKEAS